MKQSLLLRNICCFYKRTYLSHHHRVILKTQPNSSLYESTRSRLLRLYSSEFDSVSVSRPQTQQKATDAEDVSTDELKKLIDKYYGGDHEVIPSIFEAILKRKLAGKYEKEDEELMQELMRGRPSNGFQDEEFGSDSDEFSDIDEEDSD